MSQSVPPNNTSSRKSLPDNENFIVTEEQVHENYYDIKIMIIGESGSGKSSILNMIFNFIRGKKLKDLIKPARNEFNHQDKFNENFKTIKTEIQYFEIKYKEKKILLIDTPGFEPQLRESDDPILIEKILKTAKILKKFSMLIAIKSDQNSLNLSVTKNIVKLLELYDRNQIKYDISLIFTFYVGSLVFNFESMKLKNIKNRYRKINNKFFKLNKNKIEQEDINKDYEKLLGSYRKLLDSIYEIKLQVRIKFIEINDRIKNS